MKQWILLFLLSFQLFANQYEQKISTEGNYHKFAQYHYQLNKYFQDNIDYSDAIEMRVFTYNAGMLSIPLPLISVPKYKGRAPFLIEKLEGVDFEILSLQEIWNDSERDAITKFADDNQYYVYSGTEKKGKKHGLFILVKKSIVVGEVKFSEYIYKKQAWYEPLTGYVKGALRAEFTLPNGKKMFYLNTHLTAVAKKVRSKQAQELISTINPKGDYIFFSGDLNNNPYMEEQVYWPLVQHYKFLDAHLAKSPKDEGYTYDPTLNSIARNWGAVETSRERIDYLLFGRTNDKVSYYVRDSGLLFTEDLPYDECNIKGDACKLSDHFGVGAWIYLF